jgi:hypothetical protein
MEALVLLEAIPQAAVAVLQMLVTLLMVLETQVTQELEETALVSTAQHTLVVAVALTELLIQVILVELAAEEMVVMETLFQLLEMLAA